MKETNEKDGRDDLSEMTTTEKQKIISAAGQFVHLLPNNSWKSQPKKLIPYSAIRGEREREKK